MKFADDVLMAYADGELDEETARAVEAAMQTDADVARRIAEHRALRTEVGAAFGGILDEPIPERLREAANAQPRNAAVARLAEAREAKARAGERKWSWKQWTAIAASVLLGVFVGRTILDAPQSDLFVASGAGLIASGDLEDALSNQIGGPPNERARVAITATFVAKSGVYCRTFNAKGRERIAGVACREGAEWRLHTVTQQDGVGRGDYRTAESPLPFVVAETAESMMAGDALDPEQEAAARERGWRTE